MIEETTQPKTGTHYVHIPMSGDNLSDELYAVVRQEAARLLAKDLNALLADGRSYAIQRHPASVNKGFGDDFIRGIVRYEQRTTILLTIPHEAKPGEYVLKASIWAHIDPKSRNEETVQLGMQWFERTDLGYRCVSTDGVLPPRASEVDW